MSHQALISLFFMMQGDSFRVLCIVQANHSTINATVLGKWASLMWRWL